MSYSRKFFELQKSKSVNSAKRVVPMLIDLVSPKSIVDVGCGTGTWLREFQDLGVEDVLGIDGSYVPDDMLLIKQKQFLQADLRKHVKRDRGYDLAISLEVGEHLPTESSETFVKTITGLAPVVAFSAAIPLQGGTGHINVQWQSFWRDLFTKEGFVAVDAIRPQVLDADDVAYWYQQYLLMYVKEDRLQDFSKLAEARAKTDDRMLDVVHPAMLYQRNEYPIQPLNKVPAWAFRLFWGQIKKFHRR